MELNKQSIDRLDISDKATNNLMLNNVTTIGMLCNQSKTDLKDMDIVFKDIQKIEVELQLLGLNLRNNP